MIPNEVRYHDGPLGEETEIGCKRTIGRFQLIDRMMRGSGRSRATIEDPESDPQQSILPSKLLP